MKQYLSPWLITAASLGYAAAQWYLIWMFARSLGPSAVGEYSGALALATPVFVVTEMGLRSIAVSSSVEWPWRTYGVLRASGILVGSMLVIGLGLAMGLDRSVLIALAALKSVDSALDIVSARLHRHKLFWTMGLMSLANAAGTAFCTTVVVRMGGSMSAGILTSASVSILMLLVAMNRARNLTSPSVPEKPARGFRVVLAAALPVTTARGLFSLMKSLPVLLLVQFASEQQTGIYSGAAYVLVGANLVGASVQTVLLPEYRETLRDRGLRHLLTSVRRKVLLWLFLGCLGGFVMVLGGPPILSWVYGESFRLGPESLVPLGLAAASTIPMYVLNAVVLVREAYRSKVFIAGLSVACALVGAWILIISDLDLIVCASWVAFIGTAARLIGSAAVLHCLPQSEPEGLIL